MLPRPRCRPARYPPAALSLYSRRVPLLALSHATFRYGPTTILDDVTVAIERGRKIGVVGQNGEGKSTLLRLLSGDLEPTEGDVIRPRSVRVAFQVQEAQYGPDATARTEMRRVLAEDIVRGRRLHELGDEMATAEPGVQARLLAEYERLQAEHTAAGGWDVERRIEAVLSSLGLPEEAWDQPVAQFSGGERNVVGLAGVLLSRPDVMLLDEPSNHLDTWGIEWFCDFVRQTEVAVVMVSHDRHVLDRTVDEIWHVRRGRVRAWTGNYTAFREQKQRADELALRRVKAVEKEAARLEFQARRRMDMANAYDDPAQARTAKNMRRRAERLRDSVEAPDTSVDRFKARLAASGRAGDIAVDVRGLTVGYGERTVLDDAHLALTHGDRACLVGPNGSGKTTLFRALLGEGAWDNPVVRIGKSVKVGEYRQLHHDALDAGQPLLDWFGRVTGRSDTDAADLLHTFLFTRDDLERPIATLSGGEKSRVQLARLVHEDVNLLLLDEPTNHLDIQACEQLEAMLRGFDGTLLVISHDRRFLDGLVDQVIELRDRRFDVFHGSFGDWWEEKTRRGEHVRRGALELRSRKEAAGGGAAAKEAARAARESRKQEQRDARKRQRELERVEKKIESLETRRDELTAALQAAYGEDADPAAAARTVAADLATLQRDLDARYAEWETLAE